jgi:radical SAM superfamily enzyme YgiQ (UPF0313 family)
LRNKARIHKRVKPTLLASGDIHQPNSKTASKFVHCKKASHPNFLTVVGGPHVILVPEEFLSSRNVDIVLWAKAITPLKIAKA